ncbi:MAG: CPCC family cysteine-rich protein [Cocleimonas sp.]
MSEFTMKRYDVIEIIVNSQLLQMRFEEREIQLQILQNTNYSDLAAWKVLPIEIQKEFSSNQALKSADNKRYDCILMMWLKDELKGVSNEYLSTTIKKINSYTGEIEGTPFPMITCPCCGYKTLDDPTPFAICEVCWWENDGQDSHNADENKGNPNGLSLTQARNNFVKHGIYDPSRTDLFKYQKPKEMFVQGSLKTSK